MHASWIFAAVFRQICFLMSLQTSEIYMKYACVIAWHQIQKCELHCTCSWCKALHAKLCNCLFAVCFSFRHVFCQIVFLSISSPLFCCLLLLWQLLLLIVTQKACYGGVGITYCTTTHANYFLSTQSFYLAKTVVFQPKYNCTRWYKAYGIKYYFIQNIILYKIKNEQL